MTLPPTTPRPDAPSASVFLDPSDKPAASRSLIIGVHAVLLGLTVLVVWATIGRDAGASAHASVASAMSDQSNSAVSQNHDLALPPSPQATPHISATRVPDEPARASFTRPEATEPAALTPANDALDASDTSPEKFDPMIAIPQPGAAYPPTMPTADVDPYAAFGGLYGTPGATRIVYLIDASGSLIDTLPFIQNELQRALGDLQPEQSYAVLFFSGQDVTEAPPVGMKHATTSAVRITRQWIDPGSGRLIASGPPRPDAAIRRALAYQPDAIIMLSDGLTGDGDAALGQRARLLTLIDTANTQGVVFHTLQVRRPDPLSTPTRLGTLELIALQSGGVHRYLGEDDLLPE